MNIGIAVEPNALDTFRYDVRMRGRVTHGFRRTAHEARSAAQEDAAMLALCARVEERSEDTEDRDVRRPRRERQRRERDE